MTDFSKRLIAWQRVHGRHDLPWQRSRDPYPIWLSEVMLQQTQVGTVVPYFERFLKRFPNLTSLAISPLDEVLRLWAGLGYYSRARNLHRTAVTLLEEHGGGFPRRRAALENLPGLGRSTAAAIAVFAFGAREAILDGNVKRVLARHFAVEGVAGNGAFEAKLWSLAESLLPVRGVRAYTQGLMDLGTAVCTRSSPVCERCPVESSCVARERGQVAAFPAPRRRKSVPVRSVAMLLLLRGGEVLLQARPPHGIWGGLWSLPEMPIDADVRQHCADQLGCEVGATMALESLRHGFTHFTLDIKPYRCEVRRLAPRTEEPRRAWYELSEAENVGVPVPVRKLLVRLRGGE